ncbi:mannosyl-oligosaccharide alpha-1,2-mannosidase [Orbilia oligospora]|uniref:alpha-1,2-Mannosidase n=1 Tax=Orbilia oligospora TaxID=2813651 RepID=A0A7C8NKU2_ORBOL|nr:mannosyl-oligosaccharide alpha-1,2-mannosidase [Orbilia oligospora]KAF3108035.1 mannosyl-oligosaccharide alpha-1,2-mannosidase [Orbilia oligospora]
MAFSIPRNVPSFTNPQRQNEDTYWASSGSVHKSTGVQNRIGGIFKSANSDLPLYKDKPYYSSTTSTYGYRRRKRDMFLRKRVAVFAILFIGAVYWFFGPSSANIPTDGNDGDIDFPKSSNDDTAPKKESGWFTEKPKKQSSTPEKVWLERRERVKDAFLISWDAYKTYAWGFDEFHPISRTGKQMASKGLGWIIIDALDTMMLMGLTTPLAQAREWVQTTLTYDQDQEVNTFETTIRMLGGLLSAHYLATTHKMDPGVQKEADLYLEKAADLADRLLGAYNSDSGLPYASVNLKTSKGIESHADGGASSTAETSTLQLEMKYLSKLMGEKVYWQRAEKAIKIIDDNHPTDGLVPIFIYANTGKFRGREVRLGSRGDSYYEYLLKQYLQTGEEIYAEMYHEAMAGVQKHLVKKSHPSGFTFIAELPMGVGTTVSPKMDHLVCFMPGNILLGATNGTTVSEARKSPSWGQREEGYLTLSKELMRSCYEMYNVTATGLAPEIAFFNMDESGHDDIVIKSQDAHNLQRPETVESLFLMWRMTGDEIYREWGWKIFRAFMKHTAVEGGGFTSLNTVLTVPPSQRDNMESFWLAETLKYFYLLFSPNDLLPLTDVVFNTEAHPLPKFNPSPLFKTGWQRMKRPEAMKELKDHDPEGRSHGLEMKGQHEE